MKSHLRYFNYGKFNEKEITGEQFIYLTHSQLKDDYGMIIERDRRLLLEKIQELKEKI